MTAGLFRWIAAAVLMASATQAGAAGTASTELFLGSVAMDVPTQMVQRMTPLAQYLSRRVGATVSFRASPTLGSAVNEFGSEFTQIAYFTPMAYIEARAKYGAVPLAAPMTKGEGSFRLVIAVPSLSAVRSVEDLKGKSFAFGDEKALLQRAVVVGSGLALTDFSRHAYLKHYDNIAKAVLNGDFDAGILKDTAFDQFAASGLRAVYTSPPLAGYVFAASPRVPKEVIDKLRAALLDLDTRTPQGREVLGKLDIDYTGFKPVADSDYNEVRRLIEPFQTR